MTGLCGVGVRRPDGTITDYTYVKDGLGNVVWIMKGGEVIAWYKYDAWGKCEIVKDADGIGTLNPFRWKSYYYDNETGFYYINGRYYDPETMQYLDADDIENIIMTGKLTGGLDRNAITLDNTIGYRANEYNINPVTELYADPRYDPKAGYSWWDRNKKWFFRVLLIGVGLALSLITGGMYGVFCATLYGVNAAITGALIGGAIGGIAAAVTGGSFWTGFVDGAINGIIDGFASGVFLYGALSTQ